MSINAVGDVNTFLDPVRHATGMNHASKLSDWGYLVFARLLRKGMSGTLVLSAGPHILNLVEKKLIEAYSWTPKDAAIWRGVCEGVILATGGSFDQDTDLSSRDVQRYKERLDLWDPEDVHVVRIAEKVGATAIFTGDGDFDTLVSDIEVFSTREMFDELDACTASC